MQEAGVTLNEKCVFSVDTVKFLGHIISQGGIKVDLAMVEVITNLPRPTNIQELRRLLGMVNHIGKFAPDLADTTKPLHDHLKKENLWTWDTQQETAFQTLKKQLSTTPVLAHYSPEKETGVCRCIIIWTRKSPTPERQTRLEASLSCVQIADRHGAKVRPGGEGSAHSHLVL